LVLPGDVLIAAVSGGPDSMAMLHVLREILKEWGIKIHVAHFNHMFRGAESEEEASFVAKRAAQMGLDCTVETCDVPLYLKETGLSPEEGARTLRYDFLRRVAKSLNANAICTAHHANDQAETVLLHLLRGAGPEGLAAISPREGNLVRPMLEVSKEEILAYCAENNLEYCWDSSNNESIYTRNRIRLHLIPYLKQFNPRIVETLVRTADICRQENDLLQELARAAKDQIDIEAGSQQVRMNYAKIKLFHPALQRRLVRLVADEFTGRQGYLSFDHTEEVLRLKPGKVISLPGPLYAGQIGRKLVFSKKKLSFQMFRFVDPVPLSVPGITYLPALSLEIEVKITQWPDPSYVKDRYSCAFKTNVLGQPLFVRNRARGDRFQPKGMPGEKKLKDFFIDEKILSTERDRIPIILSGDKIIWVVGYRTVEGTEVSSHDKQAVVISVKKYYGHK
jgi:tRNA(Ile)-lysidine synthase